MGQQFDLSLWLKDKSRKICTRDGRPVRIICWDVKKGTQDGCYVPILALIDKGEEIGENVFYYTEDGKFLRNTNETHNCDLFFADEEEEFTEFNKCLLSAFYSVAIKAVTTNGTASFQEDVDEWSNPLLDLARKELQPEIDKEIDKAYKNIDTIVYDNGYKQGQYEIMEDLPKWKKAEKDEELDCHVAIQQDGRVVLSDFVQKDEYYITLDVLKKLPKE
jgi:hypothetical protein